MASVVPFRSTTRSRAMLPLARSSTARSVAGSCKRSPGPPMATPKQVKTWIEQARADLVASRAEAGGIRECHRRYWIQQSYEKSIKAYALMRWTGTALDEAEFT